VTDLQTGASGITGISPALSVAQRAGGMALSVYRGPGYEVYAVDSASVLAGTAVRAPPVAQSPAVLPPRDRVPSEILAMLARADSGLPRDTAFVTQAYRPRFSLDYVSQPSLAVGVSSFGTFVGGGVGLYWSDMLGNRELVTALQINGGFKDISALVGYQNTRRRWNWGVVAQQVPFYAGAYGAAIDTMFGDLVYIDFVGWYRNYAWDEARCWAVPKPDAWQRALLEEGAHLTDRMRETARPGVPIGAWVGETIDYFGKRRFGKALSIVGHGVGLEVVENPWFEREVTMPLAPGMVLCLESGFVVRGKAFVRVEREIVIEQRGARFLGRFRSRLW